MSDKTTDKKKKPTIKYKDKTTKQKPKQQIEYYKPTNPGPINLVSFKF